ncbi:hypothetical protein BV22DRAFT_1040318, partial [Leucogyrophana mollusca]
MTPLDPFGPGILFNLVSAALLGWSITWLLRNCRHPRIAKVVLDLLRDCMRCLDSTQLTSARFFV